MYARAVDDAGARLRELRHEEWEELGLAALALVLAVTVTQVRPSLALPLLLGGFVVGARGVRTLWRRWDLVDRLAGERDAYVIPEVLRYASREATMDRRSAMATVIRGWLEEPGHSLEARVRPAAAELQALVCELTDGSLELDPACAIACQRLLNNLDESPLLNVAGPPEELRSRVRQIRAGFGSRPPAA